MSKPVKCPFTGKDVSIRTIKVGPVGAIRHFGIVESPIGGYTTTMFQTEEALIDFFNTRNGTLKGKSAQPRIVVNEPSVFAAALEDEDQKERDLDDASKVSASNAVKRARDAGIVKPDR
jgi:hypothetical protein